MAWNFRGTLLADEITKTGAFRAGEKGWFFRGDLEDGSIMLCFWTESWFPSDMNIIFPRWFFHAFRRILLRFYRLKTSKDGKDPCHFFVKTSPRDVCKAPACWGGSRASRGSRAAHLQSFFFSVAFFFVDRMANQTPRFLDTLSTTICNLNNFIWQYADGIWYSSPFIWGNSHYNKIRDISAGDATICRICLSRHVKCGFHISVGDPSQMTGTPFELEPHQAWCSFQEIIPEISPPSTMKNRRSQNFIVDHYFPIFSPWNIATLRGATYIPYPISPFPLQYPSHHLPERQVSYGWLYILLNIPFLLGDIFHIFPKYQTGILHGHSMTSLLNGDIPIVYKLSLHCHIPIF